MLHVVMSFEATVCIQHSPFLSLCKLFDDDFFFREKRRNKNLADTITLWSIQLIAQEIISYSNYYRIAIIAK